MQDNMIKHDEGRCYACRRGVCSYGGIPQIQDADNDEEVEDEDDDEEEPEEDGENQEEISVL